MKINNKKSTNNLNAGFKLKIQDEQLLCEGALTFDTVESAFNQTKANIPKDGVVKVNLENITNSDSAGLSFLISLLRDAKRKNTNLYFVKIPRPMLDLGRVSGVDSLLPFADS